MKRSIRILIASLFLALLLWLTALSYACTAYAQDCKLDVRVDTTTVFTGGIPCGSVVSTQSVIIPAEGANGPSAVYAFEGNAEDSRGNFNLVEVSNPGYNPDCPVGSCLDVQSANGEHVMSFADEFRPGNESFAMCYKFNTEHDRYSATGAGTWRRTSPDFNASFRSFVRDDSYKRFAMSHDGQNTISVTSTEKVLPNVWNNVCAWYDADLDSMYLELNGNLYAAFNDLGAYEETDANFTVCGWEDSGNTPYCRARIDELYVWGRVPTDVERACHASNIPYTEFESCVEAGGPPEPPPIGEVDFDSYEDMENSPCTFGMTYRMEDTNKPYTNGNFLCSEINPYGAERDGGVVFNAQSGFFVRQWANNFEEPLELSWYDLGNGSNFTGLFQELLERYRIGSAAYMRVPSHIESLTLDETLLNDHGVNEFYLLESNIAFTLRATSPVMIDLKDPKGLYIGGDNLLLTAEHGHTGTGDGSKSKTQGIFRVIDSRPEGCACKVEIYANVHWPRRSSIYIKYGDGGIGRVDTVQVKGTFESGQVTITSAKRVHIEALITDPMGQAWGWDGTAYDGSNNDYQGKGQRERGLELQEVDLVTGWVHLKNGAAWWFAAPVRAAGTGPNDRFLVIYEEISYTGDGTRHSNQGAAQIGGKMDPITTFTCAPKHDDPTWWLHVKQVGRMRSDRVFQFEATNEGGPILFCTRNIDVLVEGIVFDSQNAAIRTDVAQAENHGGGNFICCHTIRGTDNPPALQGGLEIGLENRVVSGTWGWIRVHKGLANNGKDNTLENITITDRLEIQTTGTILTNITMPRGTMIQATDSWHCSGQGTISAGNKAVETIPGASGNDPVTICI